MMVDLQILATMGWDDVLIYLAITAVTTILQMALAAKNKRKPAGANEFTYPTAQEGRPLLVVWGKRRVLSCNAITPVFDLRMRKKKAGGIFGLGKQTVAYYYDVGLHLAVCHAADGVKQLWMGNKVIWPTPGDATAESADATLTATVAAGNIFGGYKSEGGVSGTISIQYGGAAQSLNAYLADKLGSNLPAYRGMLGLIWQQLYIGTTPYIKPMTALVKRTDIDCANAEMWYVAKANIGDDHCNAIHILYELLTSTIVGAGKSSSLIGDSFTAAADTCYDEGYGLDIVWDSAPDDVQTMIDTICEIIDGVLYQDLSTGKFEIGLARADYDPEELTTYGEDDFWIELMEYPSPSQSPSKTFVHFTDRASTKKRPAYDDDIALMEVQGSNPVAQEFNCSGFLCDEVLANRIAARNQNHASAMPKTLVLNCDRRMSDLHKNSVFKVTYPALNIAGLIVRVLDADYGSLEDGRVRLTVQEDVYGAVYTAYAAPPLPGSVPANPAYADIEYEIDPDTGGVTVGGTIGVGGQTYAPAAHTTVITDRYVWFDLANPAEWQHGADAPTAAGTYLVIDNEPLGTVTLHNEAEEVTEDSELTTAGNWRMVSDAGDLLHLQHLEDGDWVDQGVFTGGAGRSLQLWALEVQEAAAFDAEADNGESSDACEIDWTAGNKQMVEVTDDCAFTFAAPPGPANLVLKLVWGGVYAPTWPETLLWAGGAEPAWTATEGAVDVLCLYYDGTNYYGAASLDFG